MIALVKRLPHEIIDYLSSINEPNALSCFHPLDDPFLNTPNSCYFFKYNMLGRLFKALLVLNMMNGS